MADAVRSCAVALAHWAVGLDVSPSKIERLLYLYGSGVEAFDARSPKWYGCGVLAEGFHRLLRVDADCLYDPYFPASLWSPARVAIVRAIGYMRRFGAWQQPFELSPRPALGAYLVIGTGQGDESFGGAAHACTVVGWEGDEVLSVDGGQRNQHGECVCLRKRRWELYRGAVRVRDTVTGRWRFVLGWGDIDVLPFRPGKITVPEGLTAYPLPDTVVAR